MGHSSHSTRMEYLGMRYTFHSTRVECLVMRHSFHSTRVECQACVTFLVVSVTTAQNYSIAL